MTIGTLILIQIFIFWTVLLVLKHKHINIAKYRHVTKGYYENTYEHDWQFWPLLIMYIIYIPFMAYNLFIIIGLTITSHWWNYKLF